MMSMLTWTCGEQPAYMFGGTLLSDGGSYAFNVFVEWA